MGDTEALHTAPGGWYSSEVLATVLNSTSMKKLNKVSWEMSLQPVKTNSEFVAALAVVQNQADRSHWLDSLDAGPQEITEEEFLQALRKYPSTYPLTAV